MAGRVVPPFVRIAIMFRWRVPKEATRRLLGPLRSEGLPRYRVKCRPSRRTERTSPAPATALRPSCWLSAGLDHEHTFGYDLVVKSLAPVEDPFPEFAQRLLASGLSANEIARACEVTSTACGVH